MLPPRHCHYVASMNMLVTGGWDRTLKFWDCRSPTPANTQQLPERVYAMDVLHPLLVVGTADRNITIYNLTQPQAPFKTIASPLKWQTRSARSQNKGQTLPQLTYLPAHLTCHPLPQVRELLPGQDRLPRELHRGASGGAAGGR